MSYQMEFDELARWEDATSAPRNPVHHPPKEEEATPKATPPAPTLFSEVAREAGLEAVIYQDQNRIYGETVMHRIRTGQKVY